MRKLICWLFGRSKKDTLIENVVKEYTLIYTVPSLRDHAERLFRKGYTTVEQLNALTEEQLGKLQLQRTK